MGDAEMIVMLINATVNVYLVCIQFCNYRFKIDDVKLQNNFLQI